MCENQTTFQGLMHHTLHENTVQCDLTSGKWESWKYIFWSLKFDLRTVNPRVKCGFIFWKNWLQLWIYHAAAFILCNSRWGGERLKGCVFSPSSLLPVSARGKEARKRNLSIASDPVSVVCPTSALVKPVACSSVIVRFVLTKWSNGSLWFYQMDQWELLIWSKRNGRWLMNALLPWRLQEQETDRSKMTMITEDVMCNNFILS